jgi:hypothetical protein
MNHPASHSHQAAVRGTALSLLFAWALVSAPLASANTYTVTNAADSGAGSLRQAITDANNNSGLDTIEFNIDTSSDLGCTGTPKVCTIQPAAALPTIMSPVLIDGYTQSDTTTMTDASPNTQLVGDDAVILIEIDAGGAGGVVLKVSGSGAGGSTIQGLAITHFIGYGIEITNAADDVTIKGNFIGTDATGTSVTSSGTAVYVSGAGSTADNVIIGGTLRADRNIVAAGSNGILMETVTNCTIQGNYVGLDKSGEVALSVGNAVVLEGTQFGLTKGCLVGGSIAGAGNVIGGATMAGITITKDTEDIVQGNLVGTDATGTVSKSLGAYGVVFGGGLDADQIGDQIIGNLISGNGRSGILFSAYFQTPTNVSIRGNLIGTDITGKLPLGNAWCGIEAGSSGSANGVGGMDTGTGNIIAFNGTNGVAATSAQTKLMILGNSIHDNGNLGISLNGICSNAAARPLENDDNDIDAGANNRQNYPEIAAVTIGPKTTAHVSGTLNSTAASMFHLEFFANAKCDDSNATQTTNEHTGEGKVFIGSTDVTTIGNDAGFELDCTVPIDRYVITATATDTDGNTSEFSVCSTLDTIFTDGLEDDELPSPACTPSAM